MTELTISIPAYNDGSSIEDVVRKSIEIASRLTSSFEILVIDDGSSDDTSARVKKMQRDEERLVLRRHPQNLGFGPSIRESYLSPDSQWVFFVPGDGQVPPEELAKIYPLRNEFDMMLAYRVTRRDPLARRIVSRVYNAIISLLAGCRVHDVNGSALLRGGFIKEACLHSRSAFVHAELLLEVQRKGGSFTEVRTDHRPRLFGSGSGNNMSVIAATISEMTRYALARRLGFPTWPRGEALSNDR